MAKSAAVAQVSHNLFIVTLHSRRKLHHFNCWLLAKKMLLPLCKHHLVSLLCCCRYCRRQKRQTCDLFFPSITSERRVRKKVRKKRLSKERERETERCRHCMEGKSAKKKNGAASVREKERENERRPWC